MRTGLAVVGVDCAEQRLEHRGREPLRCQAALTFANEQCRAHRPYRDSHDAYHGTGAGKKRATHWVARFE